MRWVERAEAVGVSGRVYRGWAAVWLIFINIPFVIWALLTGAGTIRRRTD